ncbi:AfsR/SARP family transcriptional regulator [Wenjunlia tyrosinilytica]|uniref:Bacterial transcriptional activator domain-containing protein n=1 Tax=Wenjunlia tyrosinilytica TaxID=1544741 RepID=A0A917ZHX4_9ACTN|nr:BTAD domain-containing putative transcriptional regulator [Wenjunlia tyrosinilytica]GGO82157.1 hypothetical protein GCM10012280_08080 [Wenjunlia tyrosinilytica]
MRIARRHGGYTLCADRQAVDLHRFRHLVTQARAPEEDTRTAALLEQALALWRGQALTGADTPWAEAVREALHHERLAAESDVTDVRLRPGHHTELLGGLRTRARQHPWDERPAGQLMLTLHRCGRSAEALEHYERARHPARRPAGVGASSCVKRM